MKDFYDILLISIFSRVITMLVSQIASKLFLRYDLSSFSESSLFNQLLSWDAVHFYSIAKDGYTAEHQLAFFPLLPLLARYLGNITNISYNTAGVILSNLFTIISSIILYKISLRIYSVNKARISSIFFCFNPASIIYSSLYTESLFCMCFLFSLYFYMINNKNYLIWIFLSGFCRSNSFIFSIFCLKQAIFTNLSIFLVQLFSYLTLLRKYYLFKVFIPYSYIQSKYWGQGFLKFYSKQNLGNILFGIVFILFSLYIIYKGRTAISIYNYCLFLLIFQTLLVLFFIHWNMFFRFISYNPIIYWSLYDILKYKNTFIYKIFLSFMIFHYFAYNILFSTFYPPA